MLTLPLGLFIPGYCLIAILFPKNDEITFMERIMLSIGVSIAIVPLIGLILNFTPWGIRLDPIVISLTAFSFVLILFGYYKRTILPADERFVIPIRAIAGILRRDVVKPEGAGVDRFLNLILILVVLASVLGTVYVIVAPKEGEHFSEFYLLGENRTLSGYPDQIITGQVYPMFIGVRNEEKRDVSYTIETWLVLARFDNTTNTSRIIAMEPNDRLSFTLGNNETTIVPYNLTVRKTGYNRVEFLLFDETSPGYEIVGTDRINASYRNLHIWVTIEPFLDNNPLSQTL